MTPTPEYTNWPCCNCGTARISERRLRSSKPWATRRLRWKPVPLGPPPRHPSEIVCRLIEKLAHGIPFDDDRSVNCRVALCQTLGRLKCQAAAPELEKLQTRNWQVGTAATEALQEIAQLPLSMRRWPNWTWDRG